MCVPNSPLFQRLQVYIKQVFSWLGSFVNMFTNHRGYKRVYKFKEQYMDRSTFCEIKYMNRLFFQRSGIWLGLVSEYWLAHLYQSYPQPPPPPSEFKTFSLFVYINCVQLYSLIQVVLIDDEISPRASYSDEAHQTACAMLETGAMSIRRTNKPF